MTTHRLHPCPIPADTLNKSLTLASFFSICCNRAVFSPTFTVAATMLVFASSTNALVFCPAAVLSIVSIAVDPPRQHLSKFCRIVRNSSPQIASNCVPIAVFTFGHGWSPTFDLHALARVGSAFVIFENNKASTSTYREAILELFRIALRFVEH